MNRFILPFIGILIFYSESIFATFSPIEAFGETRYLVPRFLLLFIVLMGVYYSSKTAYLYGFVFGLLYDLFFTGIIGIYMFLFPLVVYLTLVILKLIHQQIIVVGLLAILLIAGLEFVVYQFNSLIGVAGVDMKTFLNQRLWSTLAYNALFLLILAFPFKRLMGNLRQQHFDD